MGGGQHDLIRVGLETWSSHQFTPVHTSPKTNIQDIDNNKQSLNSPHGVWTSVAVNFFFFSTSHLVDGEGHDDVRLLMNDFSFAPWIPQVCLHLEKKTKTKINLVLMEL